MFSFQEDLIRFSSIVTHSLETIKERIHKLDQIPMFAPVSSGPQAINLIVKYNRVLKHVNLMQEEPSTQEEQKDSGALPSICALTSNIYSFNKFLDEGRSIIASKAVVAYLSHFFNIDKKTIRESVHPKCWRLESNVLMIHNNLNTLMKVGCTKEQIFPALDIVFYPSSLLSNTLAQLPDRPEAQPFSVFQVGSRFLHLLHYIMDKEVGYLKK